MDQVLDEIIEAAIDIAGADFGSIQLLDPSTGALRIAALCGLPQWWADYWNIADGSGGTCSIALKRGERVIVEDVERSPIFVGTPALDIQLRAGIRAVQSMPLVNRSGKPLGVFSTYYKSPYVLDDVRALRLLDLLARHACDILDRAESDGTLRESEERRRLALDAANLGTWEWDIATDKVAWSPRQFELFGIRPEDFGGTSEEVLATIHPGDRAKLDEAIRQARDGAKPLNETFRVVHKDGDIRWVVGMAHMLTQGRGGADRMIGVNLDVTAEKKAAELLQRLNQELEEQVADRTAKLRDQSSRLRAILETALSAVFTADQNGIIQSVNPAGERIFGYTSAEMIGQNLKLLMPLPYQEHHDDYLREYRRTGVRHFIGASREVMARRKDGSLFPVLIAINEIPELKLYAGTMLDITRQKELEREVLQIASLEDQRIGQDLHDDIGQELTAAGLLTDGLTEIVRKKLPEESALAEKVEQTIRHVIAKVRNIAHGLIVADLAADGLPAALAELVGRMSETSQLRFDFQTDEDVHLADTLQATHLYHIAQEACTNALKHSAARKVEVSLGLADHAVTLLVKDDGNGISADAPEGLGQRIMRNRAKVIGAELAIESRRPRGTTIRCTLNLSPPYVR